MYYPKKYCLKEWIQTKFKSARNARDEQHQKDLERWEKSKDFKVFGYTVIPKGSAPKRGSIYPGIREVEFGKKRTIRLNFKTLKKMTFDRW